MGIRMGTGHQEDQMWDQTMRTFGLTPNLQGERGGCQLSYKNANEIC